MERLAESLTGQSEGDKEVLRVAIFLFVSSDKSTCGIDARSMRCSLIPATVDLAPDSGTDVLAVGCKHAWRSCAAATGAGTDPVSTEVRDSEIRWVQIYRNGQELV